MKAITEATEAATGANEQQGERERLIRIINRFLRALPPERLRWVLIFVQRLARS